MQTIHPSSVRRMIRMPARRSILIVVYVHVYSLRYLLPAQFDRSGLRKGILYYTRGALCVRHMCFNGKVYCFERPPLLEKYYTIKLNLASIKPQLVAISCTSYRLRSAIIVAEIIAVGEAQFHFRAVQNVVTRVSNRRSSGLNLLSLRNARTSIVPLSRATRSTAFLIYLDKLPGHIIPRRCPFPVYSAPPRSSGVLLRL